MHLRYSIWLTSLVVIILIILLAQSVYYVRERAIIDLFSSQQTSIAYQSASRIEESVARCDKGMTMLSKIFSEQSIDEEQMHPEIKTIYNDIKENVISIIEIDSNDVPTFVYPEIISSVLNKRKIEDPNLYHTLKKMNQRYTGEISGINGFVGKAIGIGIPLLKPDNIYSGAVLAVLSPQKLIDRLFLPDYAQNTNNYWLVDETGNIIFNRDQTLIGKNLDALTPNGNVLFKGFPYNSKHYGEMTISANNNDTRCIIAYAPLHVGVSQLWIVLVTPYDEVLKPIRSASLNIILGAIGLIAVVIITTFSIARSDVKRLRLKEEIKRMKEREVWQGKLLREKLTMEGIVEGSPVPTFVLDKDHKVIFWNRACTDLTGTNSEDVIGTDDYYKAFYEEKRPFLADFIIDQDVVNFDPFYGEGKVRKSESITGAYEAVRHFKNMNGKARHLHFLAAPIFDDKGSIVAAVETFLDVSKEIELTENLQEYAENLQNELNENIRLRKEVEELYNYLNSIIESLPDKIYDLSGDGIINYVSRRIHKGHGGNDPEGKHFTEYVSPEHRDYVLSKWDDAHKGFYNPYELEMVDRKGVKRNLMITVSPVKGTDRFVLVQRDITEMKDLEKKYYDSQKLAAIGQLSACIAHEVRNPLSSIKMSLQILEKRMHPEGNDFKRFKIAQREVEHLEKLVSDVLIYAKPSDPNKKICDMIQVIEHALAMVEKSLNDKEITVEKRYAHEIDPAYIDPSMISQALINIFLNAVDAMEPKGILMISLRDEGQNLILEIDDNGCGIDPEDIPYLFNPFFTRKSYGTGLGLTRVNKIIDQHNGKIEVISRKGEGTQFRIVLPRESQ